jgi:hypothetical protein
MKAFGSGKRHTDINLEAAFKLLYGFLSATYRGKLIGFGPGGFNFDSLSCNPHQPSELFAIPDDANNWDEVFRTCLKVVLFYHQINVTEEECQEKAERVAELAHIGIDIEIPYLGDLDDFEMLSWCFLLAVGVEYDASLDVRDPEQALEMAVLVVGAPETFPDVYEAYYTF